MPREPISFAVAIQEGDRELGFLQPILVRGLAKGRNREGQQQHEAAAAQRGHFREWLDEQPAPPAGDMGNGP